MSLEKERTETRAEKRSKKTEKNVWGGVQNLSFLPILSLSPMSSPHTLAVVASPIVATCERSPHSARKVSVKASSTTAGTTDAAAELKVFLAAASADGFAAAAVAAATRVGEVPLFLSVSSRSTSSSSFSHS